MPRTFTLLRTLGRGAHGAVHLAEMRDEDDYVQTLAVKRLLPECSQDPELAARLKDEARLLALLNHEHVVRVHGLTRIDGGLAVLMEPVVGADLGRLAPMPPRVALGVIEAVAEALDAAFNTVPPGQRRPLQVVHRDIKPSNVMVTPRGVVKVMDFGVARATFDAREVETRSHQYGTARYMAPERWLHGDADHRSDVFSLGITLVEIATGKPVPRARLSAEGFALDLAEAVAPLPQALRELARQMTAFSCDDRPTAAEVVATCRLLIATVEGPLLREWAPAHVTPGQGEPIDATTSATIVREETAPPSSEPVTVPAAEPPARTAFPWAPLALVPLVVLGAVWLGWPGEPPTVADPAPVAVARPDPAPAPEPAPPPPPAPAPASTVVAEPAPVPAPVPERASPQRIRPRPAPVEPVPAPQPAPVVQMAQIRFSFDSPGLVADTDWGRITRSPMILELPAGRPVEVRIADGERRWRCTISTGSGDVRIFRDGRCTQ